MPFLGNSCRKGGQVQAIGCSRDERNTKLHAITDRRGRPLAFLLTQGQAADCKAAEALLTNLPPRCIVLADRAYDTNPVRQLIEAQGAAPNIPSKVTRLWKSCFSLCSTRAATPSSACSAGSRTSAASA